MSSVNNDQNNWQSVYQQEQQNSQNAETDADGSTSSTASKRHAAESAALPGTLPIATTGAPEATGSTGSTDGVGGVRRSAAPNGGTATTGAPELPDNDGPKAPTKQVAQFGAPLSTYGMAWAALQVMATSANQEFTQQSKIKIAAEQQKTNDKEQEISDSKDQINGQREAAVNNFMGSLAGAALSGFMGYKGAKMSFTGQPSDMTQGAMYQAMGQTAGQAVTQGVKALDTTEGGQRQADDAGVRVKYDQMNEDVAQQVADASNTFITQAQQEWQKAEQTITDMTDRRMQASNNVANG